MLGIHVYISIICLAEAVAILQPIVRAIETFLELSIYSQTVAIHRCILVTIQLAKFPMEL